CPFQWLVRANTGRQMRSRFGRRSVRLMFCSGGYHRKLAAVHRTATAIEHQSLSNALGWRLVAVTAPSPVNRRYLIVSFFLVWLVRADTGRYMCCRFGRDSICVELQCGATVSVAIYHWQAGRLRHSHLSASLRATTAAPNPVSALNYQLSTLNFFCGHPPSPGCIAAMSD